MSSMILGDDCFHEWKVMPLKLIEKSFESHFKFQYYLMILHLFTKTSSATGKNISQPIKILHQACCLNICDLISS